MFSIVKTRKLWYTLSAALFVASMLAVFTWGLKPGIDFTGGSLVEIKFVGVRPANDVVVKALAAKEIEVAQVQPVQADAMIIRTKFISESKHQEMLTALKEAAHGEVVENRFETIGPTISAELKRRAYGAVAMVLAGIILYVTYAFRKVSMPVQSWKYGVVAVVALLHDVGIPIGIFAVLGKFLGYEVDVLFVTAVMTVLGFSVHDTIVTFDRIRENLMLNPRATFAETIDISIRQTITRSINTSLTVLLVLLAIYFFGGASTHHFTLVLILGVIFGTYSSIFIASPLLVTWQEAVSKRK
ncbi:MAG: Protein-export rane protein SecF [Candidatus Magasanikbacteria bacterium]|nr:Protein-export rane protein SecF [Candidatus Magasanikbacteria bacterium]